MTTAESVEEPLLDAMSLGLEGRHDSFSDVFSDALRGIPCSVHGITPEHQAVPV
ncbi:MAG: hypothetical protein JWQ93_1686, partial [Marmoricola sp.]|nr:hypothetical protein [Marmoricola sp.]